MGYILREDKRGVSLVKKGADNLIIIQCSYRNRFGLKEESLLESSDPEVKRMI